MYYSLIGTLALLTLLITNHDVLLSGAKGKTFSPVQKTYRRFLFAIIAYYFTDIMWGMLEALGLTLLLYIDTEIYFIAMAAGILFFTQYVVEYLNSGSGFRRFLLISGRVFCAAVVVLTLMNLFFPVMFYFDENGVYRTLPSRYVTLGVQIVILILTSAYAFFVSFRTKESVQRRHLTIALSGVLMLVFISIQIFFPYLPLYAIGYMLGSCLLRTFVIENEKEEYRRGLEGSLERENKQLDELNRAWELAYTDPLTGAKSRLAYLEQEDQIDRAIADGTAKDIALIVFDVNDLKKINDIKGHDVGDGYIADAYSLISGIFKNSPVFRVGGDEFVVIPEGRDYADRKELLTLFDRRIEENLASGGVIVAAGSAEYIPGSDNSYRRMFERADIEMYRRKDELKKVGVNK